MGAKKKKRLIDNSFHSEYQKRIPIDVLSSQIETIQNKIQKSQLEFIYHSRYRNY